MRKTTTGLLAPKNRKFLVAGIAAAVIGTYFLAGDKIKSLFKKDETPLPPYEPKPVIAPTPAPATVKTPAPVTIVKEVIVPGPDANTFDPDKRLLKGVKGNEVQRIQIIINDMFNKSGKKPGTITGFYTGLKWQHPLTTDGEFGDQTEKAAKETFKFFRDKKYLTLDQARYYWSYWLGYNGFDFPDSLRSSSRYQRYADRFKTGQIDKQKGN
jgi:hypothetical protein